MLKYNLAFTEMIIQAADVSNGDWAEVAHLTDMDKDFFGVMPNRYESPHIDLGSAHTYIRFVVKKTVNAGKSNRYDANGNPFVSLGRFQVYRAYEGEPDPIEEKPNINLLFIGNSITAGATLSNASTQAPPIVCRSLVEEATGVTTNVYNGGHSGITTFGYMPGRDDFTRIISNARVLRKNGGHIYISIMRQEEDSPIGFLMPPTLLLAVSKPERGSDAFAGRQQAGKRGGEGQL